MNLHEVISEILEISSNSYCQVVFAVCDMIILQELSSFDNI